MLHFLSSPPKALYTVLITYSLTHTNTHTYTDGGAAAAGLTLSKLGLSVLPKDTTSYDRRSHPCNWWTIILFPEPQTCTTQAFRTAFLYIL